MCLAPKGREEALYCSIHPNTPCAGPSVKTTRSVPAFQRPLLGRTGETSLGCEMDVTTCCLLSCLSCRDVNASPRSPARIDMTRVAQRSTGLAAWPS